MKTMSAWTFAVIAVTSVLGSTEHQSALDRPVTAAVVLERWADALGGRERLAKIHLDLPSADPFCRPADSSADYAFRSGARSARVPMVFDGAHVFVRGRLNDSSLVWLAMDTGASGSVVNADVTKGLKLELRGQLRVRGAGGAVDGSALPEAVAPGRPPEWRSRPPTFFRRNVRGCSRIQR